jgi:hypothetical protein
MRGREGSRETGHLDRTDLPQAARAPVDIPCKSVDERLLRLERAVAEAALMNEPTRVYRQAAKFPGSFDNVASLCRQYEAERRSSGGL